MASENLALESACRRAAFLLIRSKMKQSKSVSADASGGNFRAFEGQTSETK